MISPERQAEINRLTVDRSNMFYWQTDRPMTGQEFSEIFMNRHENAAESVISAAVEVALHEAGRPGVTVQAIEVNEGYKSGSVNVNRLIELADGSKLVMRMHPIGLANGYFDVEAAAMTAARPHVPTPQIITASHHVHDGSVDMLIVTELPGHNMKHYLAEHPDAEPTLVAEMGRTMARLHEVRVQGYGFFDNSRAIATGELKGIQPTFRDHVLAALPANLAVLVGAEYITAQQAAQVTHLLETSPIISCDDPRLLHNDMADWNVLTDGTTLTGVLDWDECFGGDPIADVACWSLFFGPERLEHFLRGYQEVASLPSDFDARLHIYRLRYVVSKLSLRHFKLGLQNDDIMKHLITTGIQALKTESEYFGL